jgi:hypothetical protein
VLGTVRDWKWQPDDFIDEGHFSGKGGEAFARLLAPRITAYAAEKHLLRTAARD